MSTSPSFPRCAAAQTLADACEGLVDDLKERWPLPSIYLLQDGRLRCQASRGYFQVVDGFPAGSGIVGRVVQTGEVAVLDDVTHDPDYIPALLEVVALASVPLRVRGEVVGALTAESYTPLGDDVQETLLAASALLGERIEHAGGLPPVPPAQRAARIAVALSSLTDVREIQSRTVEGAVQISGMSSGALSLLDVQDRWSVAHASGPLAEALSQWDDADHRVVAGWVSAGTSSHVPGGTEIPPSYRLLQQAGVRSISVQPLVAAGRVTGLLTTADALPVPHDPTVGAAIELLASQAAASLGMAAALQELSRRATQDSLTGLLNSAAFTQDLAAAASHPYERRATATACLLVDVDHFKQVNDTYGHLAGDRLLTALSAELARELRDGDVLYRIGGDEFAVLLRDTSSVAAEAIAQRLVDAARRVRTTVSVGAALLRTTADDVRLRADRALYLAKAAGRDRARMAVEPED